MFKFPPELLVHKGNVCYLLYVAGGLLMTVTAGSQCVDVAVRTAQNPANLLRLSNAVIGLVGLRRRVVCKQVDCAPKRKLKRLFFTDSFNSLLDMTRTTMQGSHHFKFLGWFPERQTDLDSAKCVSTRRCRIYYVFIGGVGSWPVLTLRMGNNSNKLKTYSPSNQLQWLISFSRAAQERGDLIFLLLSGHNSAGSSATNDATSERHPTGLTLGLSALSVVLLWMFLPHIAVFAVMCLGWKVQRYIH